MYPIISKFLNINRPSVALIILSWLAFNFKSIFSSYPVTINELLLLFLSLLLLELIFTFISVKKISLFFLLNAFLFLFGYLISQFAFDTLQNDLNIYIRGRFIFISIIILFNLLNFNAKKIDNFKYINYFFIIFTSINFINNQFIYNTSQKNKLTIFKHKNNNFSSSKKNNEKHILLIIFDEYQSPLDIYNFTKDSTIFNFSRKLSSNGWDTNENFHTNETYTEKSLSSLFNYNLSEDRGFAKAEVTEKLFINSLLFNDLRFKSINIVNRGIFPFGNIKAFGLNYFPESTSLISLILNNTALSSIANRTGNFKPDGFDVNYYPQSYHNMENYNFLNDSIYNNIEKKTFYYIHFYMPHHPFIYGTQFRYKKINLSNYISFWKFTNDLIINTLLDLSKSNKFKIIVTGDHGYRSDLKMNKNKTFLALYGFNSTKINEVESVQDLGNLINSNF